MYRPGRRAGGGPSARRTRHDAGVRRLTETLSALAALAAVHPHIRGPGIDYVGVFLAAAVSWVALPGPGEAALIAAGIAAAHGRLDLAAVVAVACAGAGLGGTAGWVIGLKGGRKLLTAPGPLHHLRLSTIARGDRFYERYGPIAVLLTPSWIAGIHDMPAARFLPANGISAMVWALALGMGAFLLGPSVADVVNDAGLAGTLAAGTLVTVAVVLFAWRTYRRLVTE